MNFEVGMKVLVHGRYEDFTDHLDGTVCTVCATVTSEGYIAVVDAEDSVWYVQVEDAELYEG